VDTSDKPTFSEILELANDLGSKIDIDTAKETAKLIATEEIDDLETEIYEALLAQYVLGMTNGMNQLCFYMNTGDSYFMELPEVSKRSVEILRVMRNRKKKLKESRH